MTPEGNVWVLDWYGRDDENDLTGRLYEILWTGSPSSTSEAVDARVPEAIEIAATRLRHRRHSVRERAAAYLEGRGEDALGALARTLREGDALGAAEAAWILRRSEVDDPSRRAVVRRVLATGLAHPDPRVRRLVVQLLRELGANSATIASRLEDDDIFVAVEAALAIDASDPRATAFAHLLRRGAAHDPRLRYLAAVEIARHGGEAAFAAFVGSNERDVRTAGLIALDAAFHETKHGARDATVPRRALARTIASAGTSTEADDAFVAELLAIAGRWPHADLAPSVVAALGRSRSATALANGLDVLRRLGGVRDRQAMVASLDRFLGAVADGEIVLRNRTEKLAVLDVLAVGGHRPQTTAILSRLLGDSEVFVRAFEVISLTARGRRDIVDLCAEIATTEGAPAERRMAAVVAWSRIDERPDVERWRRLLSASERRVALVALRCVRFFVAEPTLSTLLESVAPSFQGAGEPYASEYASIVAASRASRPPPGNDAIEAKAELRERVLAALPKGDPFRGRLAFRVHACDTCHESDVAGSGPFGADLRGVAKANKPPYLVDSILYPSQVVKTGFLADVVITNGGRVYSGKVEEDGDDLVVRSSPDTTSRVARADVLTHEKGRTSIMPENLEEAMTEAELVDLIAYLKTLR